MNVNQIKELAASVFGYNKKLEDYEINKENIKYASLSTRMLANAIDVIFLMVAFLPITFILNLIYGGNLSSVLPNDSLTEGTTSAEQVEGLQKLLLFNFLQILVYLTSITYFLKKYGGTPGKIILRLRVVNSKTFEAITRGQAIGRVFGYFISLLPLAIGFVWIDIDKRKQGFHDKLAGTVVIRLPKYTKAQLRIDAEKQDSTET